MIENILPIGSLNEPDSYDKLSTFLVENEIDIVGVPYEDARLPPAMVKYLNRFGGIDDHDYMFGLKHPDNFVLLGQSEWEFVKTDFSPEDIEDFLVVADSPANDPVCVELKTGAIYLFSHDPPTKAKVFDSFSDYLIHELLSFIQLVSDDTPSAEDVIEFERSSLNGEGINLVVREQSM